MKEVINHIVTVLIAALLGFILYYLYYFNNNYAVRATGITIVAVILFAWFFCVYRSQKKRKPIAQSRISKFVLVSPDGEKEKEWNCEGANSFLIGKKSSAEINLQDHFYADTIANEHAVLNLSHGCWYIEDLNSVNGVGIKKKQEDFTFKIKPMTSYKIDAGDLIYISRAKILVK